MTRRKLPRVELLRAHVLAALSTPPALASSPPRAEQAGPGRVNLDAAVEFWINVFDELEGDDERVLAEMLGDPVAARKIMQGFTSMTPDEARRFHEAKRFDEAAVRAWCEKWLRGW